MSNTLRWAPQLRAGDVVAEPFAKVPVANIDPYDIAAVAARALLTPAHEGGILDLSGPAALLPAEYVDAFFRFYVDGTLDESPVLPTVEQVTGRPPRTFEQWAVAHADAF